MYKEFTTLMRNREDWNQEELLQIVYLCLEDINWHPENKLLLAIQYGTKWDKETAAKLCLGQDRSDLEPNYMDTLNNNVEKYFEELFEGVDNV
jgi:hypothetical protein|tara:strand:+ start:84 stop:362 length:279 start_codon:yes stop_codon:yes gene_type:complete